MHNVENAKRAPRRQGPKEAHPPTHPKPQQRIEEQSKLSNSYAKLWFERAGAKHCKYINAPNAQLRHAVKNQLTQQAF